MRQNSADSLPDRRTDSGKPLRLPDCCRPPPFCLPVRPSETFVTLCFHRSLTQAGINIRPFAIEVLKDLSKQFEIIVFTASHSCYAAKVLEYLDPDN